MVGAIGAPINLFNIILCIMKKVNEVQNGDMITNTVTLLSVYGKVGQRYFIQPWRLPNGLFPECVRPVDASGRMILTPDEIAAVNSHKAYYIPEDAVISFETPKTFDLNNLRDAAEWEAIRHCTMIAPDRFAKDENGDYLIDGTIDVLHTKRPRYGTAELYIDRPGQEAMRRVTHKELVIKASTFILQDERGYDGRLVVAKVLGRNMKNQPDADVKDFLLSVADKTPEKIIDCYTGGDLNLRMLFIEARDAGVIYKKQGLYLYGEDGKAVLGSTDDSVIEWMKSPKNNKVMAQIRKDTYPEMFSDPS